MMGGLPDDRRRTEYETFASQWLAPLVAVFLRAVRDAALAYDLATETLAAAHLQWVSAPPGDEAVDWALRLGRHGLDTAVERGRVPATERRRGQQPAPRRLTVAEQQEIMALAEQHLAIPDTARDTADTLARMAPPPHVLAELRRSDLVEADQLPDALTARDQKTHGA
jgi:predicted RNA polymerase sigma factor